MSWTGNTNNLAPNNVREPSSRSGKPIGDNRSEHVRRDTDDQKSITIGLYDIDETILQHLERMNLSVTDGGNVVKLPIYYGSPELWTSARRDGYLRDKQGKVMLPVMVMKRTNSGDDESLRYFHRYLQSSVMKKYSTKNKYTQFSILSGQNAPVNEVYNIVFPSHMKLTYHFIIWTEYVEQMNKLVEDIRFNTNDYWGNKSGFKFRTQVEGFSHTTELQVGEDRIVKSEFDLTTHGYILPETITTLESRKLTTDKLLTPKKFIINTEVVATDYNMEQHDKNREKWRNPDYPNLPRDEEIPQPGISVVDGIEDNSAISSVIVSALKSAVAGTNPTVITDKVVYNNPSLNVVPPPADLGGQGKKGDVSFDERYFYIYGNDRWHRIAIALFS